VKPTSFRLKCKFGININFASFLNLENNWKNLLDFDMKTRKIYCFIASFFMAVSNKKNHRKSSLIWHPHWWRKICRTKKSIKKFIKNFDILFWPEDFQIIFFTVICSRTKQFSPRWTKKCDEKILYKQILVHLVLESCMIWFWVKPFCITKKATPRKPVCLHKKSLYFYVNNILYFIF
jgi:hypothetical protein